MEAPKKGTQRPRRNGAPAKTPEQRENQMIALAVDLAEKQLSEGTASAQVITHFLKLATTRERLEKEKLVRENQLLTAKTEALQSSKKMEELYSKAIDAMRSYGNRGVEEAGADDDID
jgi:hypothetical protein